MSQQSSRAINPLAKLLMLVILSVLTVIVAEPFYMAALVLLAVGLLSLYGNRSIVSKTIISFALLIFVTQLLFNHAGETLGTFSIFRLTEGGLRTGIVIAGKFLTLIAMSWLFVSTTRASALSAALTSAGMPYRYAYLPALSMRYVPTFRFELATVRDAQTTRGLRLGTGLRGLVKSVRYTMMPLLVSAMAKVNILAASMTGRGFGAFPRRTLLDPHRMRAWDIASVVAVTALAIAFYLCSIRFRLWSRML